MFARLLGQGVGRLLGYKGGFWEEDVRGVYGALLSENLAGQSLTSANNGHHH